jgi:hypothetical protein
VKRRWSERIDAHHRRQLDEAELLDRQQRARAAPVTDPGGRTWTVEGEPNTAATWSGSWLPFPLNWLGWELAGRRYGDARVVASASDGSRVLVRVRHATQVASAIDEVRAALTAGDPVPDRIGWRPRP